MVDFVVEQADRAKVPRRRMVAHINLGGVEVLDH
jgi:hypothetical protein